MENYVKNRETNVLPLCMKEESFYNVTKSNIVTTKNYVTLSRINSQTTVH